MSERFRWEDIICDPLPDDLPRGWVPSNSLERWVSWDLKRRWPRYQQWKKIAERRGITVMQLLSEYKAFDYLKRL